MKIELAALEVWQGHQSFGIICIVVLALFWKTARWKLVHQLLIKDNVLLKELKVWRNQDLEDLN